MDQPLKQRLIGGAVLVSLVVIFVPMMLDESADLDTDPADLVFPDKPQALQQPLKAREILPEPIPLPPIAMEPEPTPVPDTVEQPEVQPEPDPQNLIKQRTETRIANTLAKTPLAWVVQVGAFSSLQNASKLVDNMKQAKLPAEIKEIVVGGKKLYRVQTLPQLDQRDAEKQLEKIKKDFVPSAKLIRYSG